MTILKMYPTSINAKYMELVEDSLREGRLILYPTDTLYAIGCNALDNGAIERICRLKNLNPQKTNLSIICCDISQASEYVKIDNRAFRIIKEALPGPFTFILPASSKLPKVFKGRKVVGLRIPDNPIPTEIARRLGNPILTTSVGSDDDDGRGVDIADPESLALRYDDVVDMLIDGGEGGYEGSTVVDLTDSSNPVIVRQGVGIIRF
ncbi:MAG: L-threonylcarbamoyladenylate synthase [Muribaculum sp.]|nr:L-threonylcarbamoyladenylate synthase [Muribaculum sp.]